MNGIRVTQPSQSNYQTGQPAHAPSSEATTDSKNSADQSTPKSRRTTPTRMAKLASAALIASSALLTFPNQPASSAEHRISHPVRADAINNVHWSDTWGAARGGGRRHLGVDIMGPKMTPLVAVRDATVTWGRLDNGRGSIVRMRDSEGWEYQYIHLNNDTPGTDDGRASCQQTFSDRICASIQGGRIPKGFSVKEGELIGYLGDSGNAESTAPHLHFEIYKPSGNGTTAVNPTPFVNAARPASQPAPKPEEKPLPAKPAPPWSNSAAAAKDTYVAMYGRGPTTDEQRRFDAAIDKGGVWEAIAELYNDNSTGSETIRTYTALFNRQPDISGFRNWVRVRANGESGEQITARFLASREFLQKYGRLNDEELVDALYQNALGREADAPGRQHWVEELTSGRKNQAQVAYAFVRCQEARDLYRASTEVNTFKITRHGETANDSEVASWAKARNGKNLQQAAQERYGK